MSAIKDIRGRIDWWMILVLSLLIFVGVTMVYAATLGETSDIFHSRWFRQMVYFLVGVPIMFGIMITPSRVVEAAVVPLYFTSLIFLAYLALGGGASDAAKGAGRWISLGMGFKFQPSELAKVAYLLALARFLRDRTMSLKGLMNGMLAAGSIVGLLKIWQIRQKTRMSRIRNAPGWEIIFFPLFFIPFALIAKQPDLSTALVFTAMTLTMFFWSGMPLIEIFLLVSPIVSLISASLFWVWAIVVILIVMATLKARLKLWMKLVLIVLNLLAGGYGGGMVWNQGLKEHQRSRIKTFLNPEEYQQSGGYQVIQSQVTLGSGGLTGKGYLEGSQTKGGFLPEEHTDFIYSVLGEQFGFAGCVSVLILFAILMARFLRICVRQTDDFRNHIVVGVSTIIGFHVIVNIAMAIGIMPVTGLPLPFFSYGGTFAITTMVLVGMVLHVRFHGVKSID